MPYVEVTDSLREFLKSERKKRKIRGDVLSGDIGKSPSYISLVERGKIANIELDVFYNIFQKIIELPEELLWDYMNKIIENNSSLKLTKEDIEHEQWKLNFELQYRQFPIDQLMKNFIEGELNKLNKTSEDLVEYINKNTNLPEEYRNKKIPDNVVNVEINEYGEEQIYIRFNLPTNYISDILNGTIDTINYINAKGILYNIFLIEDKNDVDAQILSEEKLKEFKIMSIKQRNEMIEKALAENKPEEIDKVISEDEKNYNKQLDSTQELLIHLRDFNPHYGVQVISTFNKNLSEANNLMWAVMKQSFYKLGYLDTIKKKEFINKLDELIKDYSLITNKENEEIID